MARTHTRERPFRPALRRRAGTTLLPDKRRRTSAAVLESSSQAAVSDEPKNKTNWRNSIS